MLVEEGGKCWEVQFLELQAFKWITEESASAILASLPVAGAFYEVLDSDWLTELGAGKLAYMAEAKHFVVCCYDEVIEVVATSHPIRQLS